MSNRSVPDGPTDADLSALDATVAEVTRRLETLSAVRDRALADGRLLVRLSANAIRALHRGDVSEADRLLAEAHAVRDALVAALANHPAIYWAGYVQDAMKELAEAMITRAILADLPAPSPAEIGVEDAAYLNALAEAASELRRDILDLLRSDDLERAERYLARMDAIYAELVTVDFPDAVTGGLRRTTDALRAVLERTRGDLTVTMNQRRLERAIRATGLTLPITAQATPEPSPET